MSMQFYVYDHALLDNLGGLCDPRYNGTLVGGVSLMEFLVEYGVRFANQTREYLVRQAYPVREDNTMLESFWSSVCVCIPWVKKKMQKRKRKQRNQDFILLFVII